MNVRTEHPHPHPRRRPLAGVYRGEVACEGCAESVADLLRSSPLDYKVTYLGPDEDSDITVETLRHLDVFAWPGGGDDVDKDYKKVAKYTHAIQEYVADGGHYMGICLGAFFVRGEEKNEAFFGLLPPGSYAESERFNKGAQVKSAKDSVLQVDWTWQTGAHKGKVAKDQWVYFQDGAAFVLEEEVLRRSTILGRYSSTKDINSLITPYGKGYVGLIGTHPEADQSWYDDVKLTNPQNVSFAIGYDFVQALHNAGSTSLTSMS